MNEFRWGPQGVGEPGLVKPGATAALGAPNSSPQCPWRAPWWDGDGLFTAMQGERVRNKEKLKEQSFSLAIRNKNLPYEDSQMCILCSLWRFSRPSWRITELICCKQKAKSVASWGHSQSELSHGPVTSVEKRPRVMSYAMTYLVRDFCELCHGIGS